MRKIQTKFFQKIADIIIKRMENCKEQELLQLQQLGLLLDNYCTERGIYLD